MTSSILTPKDRARLDVGLLPIDVDPPRRLTNIEVSELPKSNVDLGRFEPMFCNGYLIYVRREV